MTEETLRTLEEVASRKSRVQLRLKDGRTLEVTNHYGEYHYFRYLPANEHHWSYFASLTRNEVLALLGDN